MHNNGLQCSRRGGVPITRGESGVRATAAGLLKTSLIADFPPN